MYSDCYILTNQSSGNYQNRRSTIRPIKSESVYKVAAVVPRSRCRCCLFCGFAVVVDMTLRCGGDVVLRDWVASVFSPTYFVSINSVSPTLEPTMKINSIILMDLFVY